MLGVYFHWQEHINLIIPRFNYFVVSNGFKRIGRCLIYYESSFTKFNFATVQLPKLFHVDATVASTVYYLARQGLSPIISKNRIINLILCILSSEQEPRLWVNKLCYYAACCSFHYTTMKRLLQFTDFFIYSHFNYCNFSFIDITKEKLFGII